jgi:branched-chain amino acid transport system ATP-binding protein
MSELNIEDLWKRFDGNEVLRGLSLSIERGSIAGVVAMNGAGKTTMINVLFSVYPKDTGRAWFRGQELPDRPQDVVSLGLARTFQNARLPKTMTVSEVVRAVLAGRHRSWADYYRGRGLPDSLLRAEVQMLSWFGLADCAHAPAGSLPFGLQRKVDLARSAATGAKFLFLDEPAAGLSEAEEQDLAVCIKFLRDQHGFTFVVIDHRIEFLRRIVDRVVFLHEGKVGLDSSSTSVEAVLQSSLLKLHYFGAADTIPETNGAETRTRKPLQHTESAPPLAVDDVSVNRDTMPVVRSVSYVCLPGMLSAIVGPNGAGKSSLLECMAGIIPLKSGRVRIDGVDANFDQLSADRAIALVPESADVFPGLTVEENLRLGSRGGSRSSWTTSLQEVSQLFPKLGQYRRASASILSGGERKMLALARAKIGRPRVLLVDEPSAGMAPAWIRRMYGALRQMAMTGIATVVTESQAGICKPYVDRLNSLHRGRLNGAGEAGSGTRPKTVIREKEEI